MTDGINEFDLERLLDIPTDKAEELDNSSALEVNILNDEDDVTIEEPHIKFPTKQLESILKISALLATTGMGSMDSKSVCMDIKQGYVNFLLTDSIKTNVERKVEILNKSNQFTGTLVFTSSVLAKVIKICSSVFTLIERVENGKKNYILKILGGEMYLDNINNTDINTFQKSYDSKSLTAYSSATICNIFKKTFGYVGSAIKDKRMYEFSGGLVQAYPHGSAVKCECKEPFNNFNLLLVDAKLLYTLATGDPSESIKINKDGTVFVGDNYSLIVSKITPASCAYSSLIDRMFAGNGVSTDVSHLMRVTDLSYGLEYSSGNINFNYNDKGNITCELLTKRRNNTVELRCTPNLDVTILDSPVEISSVNLRNVLSVFSGDSVAVIRISNDGISIESNDCKAIVLGRGVGK